ncbi:hypothetical protein GCM10008940_15970 [Microbulbifer agarilyticus]
MQSAKIGKARARPGTSAVDNCSNLPYFNGWRAMPAISIRGSISRCECYTVADFALSVPLKD